MAAIIHIDEPERKGRVYEASFVRLVPDRHAPEPICCQVWLSPQHCHFACFAHFMMSLEHGTSTDPFSAVEHGHRKRKHSPETRKYAR